MTTTRNHNHYAVIPRKRESSHHGWHDLVSCIRFLDSRYDEKYGR